MKFGKILANAIIFGMIGAIAGAVIGLAIGLVVNTFVKPYNNRHLVVSLLLEVADNVPDYLARCVIYNPDPALSDL